jgi:hypothetical protein
VRTVKMAKLISKSIDRTILILFRPFSLKKWLLLLLIAFLAGSLGGSFGNGGGGGHSYRDTDTDKVEQKDIRVEYGPEFLSENDYTRKNHSAAYVGNINLEAKVKKGPFVFGRESARDDAIFYSLVGVFIFFGVFFLALIIVFTWLASRFKFVWFNAIVNNDASISEPFARYKREGNSLFKLLLALLVIVIVFLGAVGFWGYFNGASMGIFAEGANPSFGQVIKAFILPVLTLIGGIILLMIFGVGIEHFVIPIMAVDGCLFREAWPKFVSIVKQNKKDFFIYFLLLIGLSITAAIAILIILLALFLGMLIVAAILFGLPYLILGALLKLHFLFVIFAIIIGIPFVAVMVLVFMSISLPFAVFFRSFSLYFLSSLNCGYYPLEVNTD